MVEVLIVASLLALFGLLVLSLYVLVRARDVLSLMGVYLIFLVFDLVVWPIYCVMTGQPERLGPYIQQGFYTLKQQYPITFTVILCHVIFLLIGYFAFKSRRPTPVPAAYPEVDSRWRYLPIFAGLSALWAYAIYNLLSIFGSLEQFYNVYMRDRFRSAMHLADKSDIAAQIGAVSLLGYVISMFWIFTLLLFLQYLVKGKTFHRNLFFVCLAQLIVLMALQGYRQPLVFLVLVMICMVYYVKGVRTSISRFIRYGIVIFGVVVAATLLQSWAISRAWGSAYDLNIGEAFLESLSPNKGFDAVAGVTSYFPQEHPFLYGESILDVVLAPIPRAIWPSKKVVYGVDWINSLMGLPPSTTTAITLMGEYYLNFWLPGVIIFSLVQGVLMHWIDNQRSRSVFVFLLIYSSVVSSVNAVYGMGFISAAWMLVLALERGALLVLFGVFLSGRRRRRKKGVSERLLRGPDKVIAGPASSLSYAVRRQKPTNR